jgi:hypothetical protein
VSAFNVRLWPIADTPVSQLPRQLSGVKRTGKRIQGSFWFSKSSLGMAGTGLRVSPSRIARRSPIPAISACNRVWRSCTARFRAVGPRQSSGRTDLVSSKLRHRRSAGEVRPHQYRRAERATLAENVDDYWSIRVGSVFDVSVWLRRIIVSYRLGWCPLSRAKRTRPSSDGAAPRGS